MAVTDAVILGFQQYLAMFGNAFITPTALVPQWGKVPASVRLRRESALPKAKLKPSLSTVATATQSPAAPVGKQETVTPRQH
ncbi:unnamed protein product [Ilex paraguariensis]|uniref:Uncharacterized protein n=1 Tax=Ilex paraguariensis TaxID=185542 RepID=A0ABC8U3G4_9AQUA